MDNFLDLISIHIKLNHVQEEIIIKEKLVYIIITKVIDVELILIDIVINYVQKINVIINSVIIHIIKFNKYIIQVDINRNFVNHIQIKI